MTNSQIAQIENLRTFALSHNKIAFAHLCTAALNGETWAEIRMEDAVMLCDGLSSEGVLDVIRTTDTDRPDGLIARSLTVV